MPPTAKAVGFTLSRSTAATRHGTSGRSIRGPITTAPAAWHHDRSHHGWPARIHCDSTAFACVSYHAGLAGLYSGYEGQNNKAPKVSEAWGLKVVCSPVYNIVFYSGTDQAPCGLSARRKIRSYPSPV